MNRTPSFYYRMKPDLTCEITCAVCGETVPISTDESYLLRDCACGQSFDLWPYAERH